MKRREERPPVTVTADARANEFPNGVCLVCGQRARVFSAREVPKLLGWIKGEVSDSELSAAVWLVHPNVEGCFVSVGTGVSICATKGVTR
jgi:hypothetical protein